MKKSYLMMAVAAGLMLTACSSDDDIVATNLQQNADQAAVGFDTYLTGSTETRAGHAGVITNTMLQSTGFGVMAYHTDGTETGASTYDGKYDKSSTGSLPNFMYNQYVGYSSAAWSYTPLKYWPNETFEDSQDTPAYSDAEQNPKDLYKTSPTVKYRKDRLTFFAYAPYVKVTTSSGALDGGNVKGYAAQADAEVNGYNNTAEVGITSLTGNTTKGDPKVYYTMAYEPAKSVDLLWGVAPVGGLNYTPVNGVAADGHVDAGKPLIDLVKPDVNTKMKFLFQHALVRLGVQVVGAFDQIVPGGDLDPNSKVTIKEIRIKGDGFTTKGVLNLNNTDPNVALWAAATGYAFADPNADGKNGDHDLVITAKNGSLSKFLRFKGTDGKGLTDGDIATYTFNDAYNAQAVGGVNSVDQYAIQPTIEFETATPEFGDGKTYYTSEPDYLNVAAPVFQYKGAFWSYNPGDNTYYSKQWAIYDPAMTVYTLEAVTCYDATDFNKAKSSADAMADKDKKKTAAFGGAGTYYKVKEVTDLNKTNMQWKGSPVLYAVKSITPNYLMFIPDPAKAGKDLDVQVSITYYVTTEDTNLEKERAQVEQTITKDVKLMKYKNGRAYNLRLILGLTSVKIEAEANDWQLSNVDVNLPQNTAD